jgi:hypothetical protein
MQMQLEISDKYDKEFINLILEIEKRYELLAKHVRLRIESWIRKLCIVTNNKEWKKNRNLHAILMLDMILNNKLEPPYTKFADETKSLPLLNKTNIKAILSNKIQEIYSAISEENNIRTFSKQFFDGKIYKEQYGKLKQNKQKIKEIALESKEKSKKYRIRTKSAENIPIRFKYEKDIDGLKDLLNNLQNENSTKDKIIFKQNEEKKKLSNRIKELEDAIEKLIILRKEGKDGKKIMKNVSKVLASGITTI